MVSTRVAWRISGDYFENCNCAILCPCLFSNQQAPPTEGHCDVPLAFHIAEGRYGDVPLDGLNVVAVVYTPGPMAHGDWTIALYVDDRADPAQRSALTAIFGGGAGGPMGAISAIATTNHGVRQVPIHYAIDGHTRRVSIPGILEMEVDGLRGADRQDPPWLENVRHPVSTRLAAARGAKLRYQDHGFDWEHTGRNGHFAPFRWQVD